MIRKQHREDLFPGRKTELGTVERLSGCDLLNPDQTPLHRHRAIGEARNPATEGGPEGGVP